MLFIIKKFPKLIPKNYRTVSGFSPQTVNAKMQLDYIDKLDVNSRADGLPVGLLSGIICTIGPSSRNPNILIKMIESGMNIARLNFSHGSHEYHEENIKNIRYAVAEYSKKIGLSYSLAIALDTKGPEIRTGIIESGPSAEVELKRNEIIKITTNPEYEKKCSNKIIYVDYKNIINVVKIGDNIFIDDGLISLICKNTDGDIITCEIENGGILGSQKGVNLPGIDVDLPSISEKDKNDLKFAVDQQIDLIFASFVRNAKAIEEIRFVLGEKGKNIKVISKIENYQGIYNIDEIIEASDGVMVARGDLGIEIPTEKIFLAQKSIIAKCNRFGKPAICATQMLESMIKKPRPTRAESSDVANAILDGADCVMLSGETAKGDYPVTSVLTMANICKEAEASFWQKRQFEEIVSKQKPPINIANTVAIAAVTAAARILASAIIAITNSGRIAHLISKYRPCCPIIFVTSNSIAARQSHLYRAIIPFHILEPEVSNWLQDVDRKVKGTIQFARKLEIVKPGDHVIIVAGWRRGSSFTNTMRITYIPTDYSN